MTRTRRLMDRLYLAAVIALLLLMSLASGYVVVAIAIFLFGVGLYLYPALRQTAILSGLLAAIVALAFVALGSS